jgi:hypothetical protein
MTDWLSHRPRQASPMVFPPGRLVVYLALSALIFNILLPMAS